MPRGEKVYRRLPGRESGLLSYSRLWLGPDHLLLARTTFLSEEYKRFYFRDIQAIVTRRTERREISNVIFAFTALVLGVLAVFTDAGWRVFFLVMTGTSFVRPWPPVFLGGHEPRLDGLRTLRAGRA